MSSASLAKARPCSRGVWAATWVWLLTVLALLIATVWFGIGPLALSGLADGIVTDAVLIAGLCAATALRLASLRRERSDVGDGLHDATTGLFTRAYADETAACLAARELRAGRSRIVLVVLSLTDSDKLARRYGSEAIVALLAQVAATLASQCRASDVPFRHAAASLGVYLDCDRYEQAEVFSRRIRMLLASEQLEWDGDVLKATVAMGIAAVESGEALPELYRRAEHALADG